jgi:hypothetical protein
MILNFIISFVAHIVDFLFGSLPNATIADLPYVGDTIQVVLIQAVSIWNSWMVTFPYSVDVWNRFVFGIIPFELLLVLVRFILGNRTPVAH